VTVNACQVQSAISEHPFPNSFVSVPGRMRLISRDDPGAQSGRDHTWPHGESVADFSPTVRSRWSILIVFSGCVRGAVNGYARWHHAAFNSACRAGNVSRGGIIP